MAVVWRFARARREQPRSGLARLHAPMRNNRGLTPITPRNRGLSPKKPSDGWALVHGGGADGEL
jgi:hypothetical protein